MSRTRAANEVPFSRREFFLAQLEGCRKSSSELLGRHFGFSRTTHLIPRLRPHKIHRLSAQFGRTIYAVEIAADLRATFYVEGETVWSVSIGTHDIYKG
jgi:hypothetical protein